LRSEGGVERGGGGEKVAYEWKKRGWKDVGRWGDYAFPLTSPFHILFCLTILFFIFIPKRLVPPLCVISFSPLPPLTPLPPHSAAI